MMETGHGQRSRSSELTCCGAVVSYEGCHVHLAAIYVQIPHAADEVLVGHGEVLWEVGDPSQEQRACQVQGPAGRDLGHWWD